MKYPKSGRMKLRGKKTKLLSCGCCWVFNSTEEIINKIAQRELKQSLEEIVIDGRIRIQSLV